MFSNHQRHIELLKRHTPFDQFSPDDLDWLASQLDVSEHQSGDILFSPGEHPAHLIFLVSGKVRIEAVGEAVPEERRLIAEIVPGECFPVEALHEVRPVFSTYRASEAIQVLRLPAAEFPTLKARVPSFAQYCEDRATAFLGSSKKIFEAHFGRRADNAISLEAPLSSLRLRMPDTCAPDTPILEAARILGTSGELSVVVVNEAGNPLGVFTLHDLVNRVILENGDLMAPTSDVMSIGLVTLPLEANGYEAAQAMAEHGLRQILVVDRGQLKGAISERDLFAAQHMSIGQLSARIRKADSIEALTVLAGENWKQAKHLMQQGLAAEPLTRIISSLNDRLTDRILDLCRLEIDKALPEFCWIALGSEGRHEQTLSTDQDNGIIFADVEDIEDARQRLLAFAQRANAALAECGVPLCKGGIMAGNPLWCLSLSEWKQRFATWIDKPDSDGVLNATIFFDFRPLYGQHALAEDLKVWLVNACQDQRRFFANLSIEALKRGAPLGLFRDFTVEDHKDYPGTIDLKLSGVTLFVDAARILGLSTGCGSSSTGDRLRHAAKALRIGKDEVESWVNAFHFVQMLRLRAQYESSEAGSKPHNRIDPYKLNEMDRKMLVESLKQAKRLQKRLEMIVGQH